MWPPRGPRSPRRADRVTTERGLGVLRRLVLAAYPDWFRSRHGGDLWRFWEMQRVEPRYRGLRGWLRWQVEGAREVVSALVMRAGAGSGGNGRGAGYPKGEGMGMSGWVMDVRYALRTLVGAPLFTSVAVVTLALGIGSTASVFTVLDGVVLRPLPYPEAERLVRVVRTLEEGMTPKIGWPDFEDWRERTSSFLGMAAYTETDGTFEWAEGAEVIEGARASRDLFSVFGVSPALGRTFSEEEDRLGGPRSIVLSHGLWVERFGGDPDVLGRTVPLEGELVPVVGVMPAGFAFPDPADRFWVPLQGDQLLADVGLPTGTRTLFFLDVVARLADGIEAGTAQEALGVLAAAVDDEVGKQPRHRSAPVVTDLRESIVGDTSGMLAFLLAAAGMVLLVACANVAGLVLSRAAVRERELAVRTALGAGRGRLFRQLMAESALLSITAGLVGLLLALGLTELLLAVAPDGMPRLTDVRMSGTAIGFAALLTIVSGLAFGLTPAWRASRTEVAHGLTGGRSVSAGGRALRPQHFLVGLQVSLAVVLLTGAALLVNSFARLLGGERGFDAESVVVASVSPSESRYASPEEVETFYARLLERVRALPGVTQATSTWSPPLVGNDFFTSVNHEGVSREEEAERREVGTVIVRSGYFETNGVPLVAGRDFDSSDRLGEPMVAIVNEAMAREFWPGEDPLGKRFVFTGGLSGSADSFDKVFFPDGALTVVGVAGDVRRSDLAETPGPEYYRPHSQITWTFQYLMVRTAGDPADVSASLRDVVWSVDPTVPVDRVELLSARVSASVAEPRFRMLLLGGFAGLTCLLAMVGLYAIMTLAVARRTRELGIRLALGASGTSIVREVLGRGARLVGIGTIVGLGVAAGASRLLAGMLFEIEPTDPLTYAAVSVVVASVAVLACWIPARRAGRVDPVRSLQAE